MAAKVLVDGRYSCKKWPLKYTHAVH